ncbi:MAG: alcohol dehydrogenase catalytic domain-containing protein, partial [Edaphobacter sp.]
MSEIHGLAVHAAGAQLLAYKYDPGALRADEVEIKISHCGVCFSDVHLSDNDWGMSKYPFVPGHEIIGAVVTVGSAVKSLAVGDRVGVGWQADSCGICEWCRKGEEHLCAKSQPTCVGRNGGFADKIRVNWRFAIPVPAALDSEQAAPLLCAGITVYSPLRNHGV